MKETVWSEIDRPNALHVLDRFNRRDGHGWLDLPVLDQCERLDGYDGFLRLHLLDQLDQLDQLDRLDTLEWLDGLEWLGGLIRLGRLVQLGRLVPLSGLVRLNRLV